MASDLGLLLPELVGAKKIAKVTYGIHRDRMIDKQITNVEMTAVVIGTLKGGFFVEVVTLVGSRSMPHMLVKLYK